MLHPGKLRRCIAVCALLAASAIAQTPFKVLGVYDATDGGHAPMSIAGKPVLEQIGTKVGFTLDYTADKTVLNDANLAKYDLLMVVNFFPFNLGASQQAAIQKFVEGGKGWIVVHSSGCEIGGWPWFGKEIMGGTTWKNHDNLRQGTLIIEDHTHPITKNLPATISLTEEWYRFNVNPRPNVTVVAKSGNTNDAAYDNEDHPLIWISKSFPKALYISPGHDASDWKNADYIQLFHDAIVYAGPAATRIALQQAYLGASRSGRAWIRDGVLHLGPRDGGASAGAAGGIRLTDAGGRIVALERMGDAYRILGPLEQGAYFVASAGNAGAAPVVLTP
jgi:type 1 glutamine amidotransferase